jgi:hypothetical protein
MADHAIPFRAMQSLNNMTPTKPRIREPRIKTLQIRVSEREYQRLYDYYSERFMGDELYSRSFTDWLRQTLLKQTK